MNYLNNVDTITYQCAQCGSTDNTIHKIKARGVVDSNHYNYVAGLCKKHFQEMWREFYRLEREWQRSEAEWNEHFVSLDEVIYADAEGNEITRADTCSARPAHRTASEKTDARMTVARLYREFGWGERKILRYLREKCRLEISNHTVWRFLREAKDVEAARQAAMQQRAIEQKAIEQRIEEVIATTPNGLPIPVDYSKRQERVDWLQKIYDEAVDEQAKARILIKLQRAIEQLNKKRVNV